MTGSVDTAGGRMTTEECLELAAASPTWDLPTAGRAFGLGVNASYEAAHRGELPVRVLRIGRKLRVPSADILAALGLDRQPIGDDAA